MNCPPMFANSFVEKERRIIHTYRKGEHIATQRLLDATRRLDQPVASFLVNSEECR